MRFILWQQAMLVIFAVGTIFAYVLLTYVLVRGRSLTSAMLRIVAIVLVTSLVWVALSGLLFVVGIAGYADETIEYGMVQRTYERTFGLPFNIPEVFPALSPYLENLTLRHNVATFALPIGLLAIGALVLLVYKVFSRTRYSIDQHQKTWMRLFSVTTAMFLAFLLWPQPSRNPQMPSVPIPDEARGVTYGQTSDEHSWDSTTFVWEGKSVEEIVAYYRASLEANGWQLESGGRFEEYPVTSANVLFRKDSQLLDVAVQGWSRYVTLTVHPATPADLVQLLKPASTLMPRPEPSFTAPLPTISP